MKYIKKNNNNINDNNNYNCCTNCDRVLYVSASSNLYATNETVITFVFQMKKLKLR